MTKQDKTDAARCQPGQATMTDEQSKITIRCDASPILAFIKLFAAALQGCNGSLDVGDLGFELARVENDVGAASADELVARVYPSDAFLRFAETVFAGDADFGVVEDAGMPPERPIMTDENYEKLYRDVDSARLLYQARLREVSYHLGRIRAGEAGTPSLAALEASIQETLFVCMTLYGDTLTATEVAEGPSAPAVPYSANWGL